MKHAGRMSILKLSVNGMDWRRGGVKTKNNITEGTKRVEKFNGR